jgi:hypothetical protein
MKLTIKILFLACCCALFLSCEDKKDATDFLLLIHNQDMDTLDICVIYRGDGHSAPCAELTKKDTVLWKGQIYNQGNTTNLYVAKLIKMKAGGILETSNDNWIASIEISHKGESIHIGAGSVFRNKHYEVIQISGIGKNTGILSNGTNFEPKEYAKWKIEALDDLTKAYFAK